MHRNGARRVRREAARKRPRFIQHERGPRRAAHPTHGPRRRRRGDPYLIRDRDAKFPARFGQILTDAGITTVLTGVRTPCMNSIMERWVQELRCELLDRTLIWNHRHLLRAAEFEEHHNQHRPHQAMDQAAPLRPGPNQSATRERSPGWTCAGATASEGSSTSTTEQPDLCGRSFRQAQGPAHQMFIDAPQEGIHRTGAEFISQPPLPADSGRVRTVPAMGASATRSAKFCASLGQTARLASGRHPP